MGWLIAVLGTGLALGGTIAIYFGAPYIQVEWGYSEVIAGTTALSAGIVTVALAAILFALQELRRPALASGDGTAKRSGPAAAAGRLATVAVAPPPSSEPYPARTEARAPDDEPALFRPTQDSGPAAVPPVDQAPTVVGRYEANGASYVLFSDGSIEVESETGTHRYASMQELRAHIERQEAN